MSILKEIKTFWLKWKWPITIIVIVLVLAGIWRFSFLQKYADIDLLRNILSSLREKWWIPFAIIPMYILASSLLFPNMALDAGVILTFGGLKGWSYAIMGSLISSSFYFLIGNRFGAKRLEQIQNSRLRKLKKILHKGGLATVLAVRLIPIAPFTVVNVAAGAFHIKYCDFIVGTFIALLPGTITLTLFGKHLPNLISDPNIKNISIIIAILIVGAIVTLLIKKFVFKSYKE